MEVKRKSEIKVPTTFEDISNGDVFTLLNYSDFGKDELFKKLSSCCPKCDEDEEDDDDMNLNEHGVFYITSAGVGLATLLINGNTFEIPKKEPVNIIKGEFIY